MIPFFSNSCATLLLASLIFCNASGYIEIILEEPGIQESTMTFAESGVEKFDLLSAKQDFDYNSTFGNNAFKLTGVYKKLTVRATTDECMSLRINIELVIRENGQL